MSDKQTHVFKMVDGLELKADVYPAPQAGPRPVLVFIHGGALMGGSRAVEPTRPPWYTDLGMTFVSIDYRLAPATKIPAIVEDVLDAIRWVRTEGPALFNIDPNRLAISGGSAGGYLTLTCGFRLDPPAQVLVPLWGYGGITGDWLTVPGQYQVDHLKVSEEDAFAPEVMNVVVADPMKLDPTLQQRRGAMIFRSLNSGDWPKLVSDHDPHTEPPEVFDPFCPVRNVSDRFPPTLLIHGDKDTAVPVQESIAMGEALTKVGEENEVHVIPGGWHGCFWIGGPPTPAVNAAIERMFAFLKKHLRP